MATVADDKFSDGSFRPQPNYFDRTSARGATLTCKSFDYANPRPEMIFARDIVLGLARESRFNGQTATDIKYTVAQHSHYVYKRVVEIEPLNYLLQLEAILHDGAEFVCKDLPRPLKVLLPSYKEIELRVDSAIRLRFGLPAKATPIIKVIDCRTLATECRDICPPHDEFRDVLRVYTPYSERIEDVWSEQIAEREFGGVFGELLRKTNQPAHLWA